MGNGFRGEGRGEKLKVLLDLFIRCLIVYV